MVEKKEKTPYDDEVKKMIKKLKKGKLDVRKALTTFPEPSTCPEREEEETE